MLMLVPYLVSIAVGSTVLTIFSKEYLDTTRQIAAKGQAKQAMEYNSALQKYLDENYETLKTAQSFEVSAALLKQQGRLPSYFPDKNNYGEAYISYVTPVTTASGKIILKSVTGIGSSKMGADMNRYLALATGNPLAGVTQDGKMYGLNNSYTMDSTHDLSKNGNVHVLAMSGGDYMQDIKLAPGYSSVEAYTPNNAGLSGPVNFPPPPPPSSASGGGGGGGGGCGGGPAGSICLGDGLYVTLVDNGDNTLSTGSYTYEDSRGSVTFSAEALGAARSNYDLAAYAVYNEAVAAQQEASSGSNVQ